MQTQPHQSCSPTQSHPRAASYTATMRLLLAKRLTAIALRRQVLSSPPTIWAGRPLHESSRRFYSDDARTVDPSWVRRVTEVPVAATEPQVTEVPASVLESQVESEEPAPAALKRRRKSLKVPKAEKSDDASLPFTPPSGTEVDTAGCIHLPLLALHNVWSS